MTTAGPGGGVTGNRGQRARGGRAVWLGVLAQVGEAESGPGQMRWLPGSSAQPVDDQVEVAMAELVIGLRREAAGQRAGQAGDQHADVAGGDVRAERAGSVGRVNKRLDRDRPGLAGAGDLLVAEGDLSEQRGNHRGGAHVDGPVHVPGQGDERVGFFPGRLAGLLGRALQRVQHDRADQRLAVGKPAVQGGDPGPGPPGDLLKGGARAALDEYIAGRLQQPALVVAGVGAQRPPRRAVPDRRHCDLRSQPDFSVTGNERPSPHLPEEYLPDRD